MKKIMIALAVAAFAVVSQGAALKWASASNVLGVDVAAVDGNGSYSASGEALKGNSALTFTMTLFAVGTDTVVGEYTGALKYGTTNKKVSTSFTIAEAALNTSYDYMITITGTQTDLQALGVVGDWDYSAATIEATLSGSITTASSGTTQFAADPTSWTVAGVTAAAIPEPTSGLLLLLGMAGLALRRKQS